MKAFTAQKNGSWRTTDANGKTKNEWRSGRQVQGQPFKTREEAEAAMVRILANQ